MEYTLAEIRNGTGFPKDARFVLAGPGSVIAVLREFIADVEAAGGPGAMAEDWPDLAVTYAHAVAALKGGK